MIDLLVGTWVWLFIATGGPKLEPLEVCCFPNKSACEAYQKQFIEQDRGQHQATGCTRKWQGTV